MDFYKAALKGKADKMSAETILGAPVGELARLVRD